MGWGDKTRWARHYYTRCTADGTVLDAAVVKGAPATLYWRCNRCGAVVVEEHRKSFVRGMQHLETEGACPAGPITFSPAALAALQAPPTANTENPAQGSDGPPSGRRHPKRTRLEDSAPNQLAHIVLLNPKTPQNVGSVLRASECFGGVGAVLYTGTRFDVARRFATAGTFAPKPQHPTPRAASDAAAAVTTATADPSDGTPLLGVEPGDISDTLPDGTVIVAVDLIEGAESLFGFRHPPRAAYVFGPEDGTIGADVLAACDRAVFIPMQAGCLNLAATVNVVLYDRAQKAALEATVPAPAALDAEGWQTRNANNRLVWEGGRSANGGRSGATGEAAQASPV